MRSKSRRRNASRSRSRSSSYESRRERRGKKKERSRSRSKSKSRAQQLAPLAAVVAIGALAGYALKNKGNKETIIVPDRPRRSRSRRRRASLDSYDSYATVPPGGPNNAQNPDHRNRVMAQAGLASAAAAGIWDRYRSKSRGGRSKSRIRQGVPIAAAGLGGARSPGCTRRTRRPRRRRRRPSSKGRWAGGDVGAAVPGVGLSLLPPMPTTGGVLTIVL